MIIMQNRTEQNTDSSHAEALIIATHVIANDSEAICSVNGKHKRRCFGASNLFKRLLRRAKPLQLPSSRTRSDVKGGGFFSPFTSHHSPSFAFTLSEVIITLGIIGLLAAMTIPAMLNRTNDTELKNAWRKSYSVLSNAYNLVLQENGGSIKGLCSDQSCFLDLFALKLNQQKLCNNNAKTACYLANSQIKNLAGVLGTNLNDDILDGMVLTDGTYVGVHLFDAACNFKRWAGVKTFCGVLYVDVNGKKHPNTQGKDIFMIYVDSNKAWPAGVKGDEAYQDRADHSCGTADPTPVLSGIGCSAQYLQE